MAIEIRKVKAEDETALIDICYITGDPKLKQIFPDKQLFGMFWCLYYVWFEPENCFVAVDSETNKVIGYILSTKDTEKQEKHFKSKMTQKIKARRKELHLQTFRSRVYTYFIINKIHTRKRRLLYKNYPAHLHIDILPQYQRKGIGHRLMQTLEKHLESNNVIGYHLEVGVNNKLGISFYQKYGLELYAKNHFDWIYVKKLKGN